MFSKAESALVKFGAYRYFENSIPGSYATH